MLLKPREIVIGALTGLLLVLLAFELVAYLKRPDPVESEPEHQPVEQIAHVPPPTRMRYSEQVVLPEPSAASLLLMGLLSLQLFRQRRK